MCALCRFGPILRATDRTERLNLVLSVKIENLLRLVYTDKKSQFNLNKQIK